MGRNRIGMRIGMLTVIRNLGTIDGTHEWLCQCDCGNEISLTDSVIRSKTIRHCGCMRGDKSEALNPDYLDKPVAQFRRNIDSQIREARRMFTPIDKSQFNDDFMFLPL